MSTVARFGRFGRRHPAPADGPDPWLDDPVPDERRPDDGPFLPAPRTGRDDPAPATRSASPAVWGPRRPDPAPDGHGPDRFDADGRLDEFPDDRFPDDALPRDPFSRDPFPHGGFTDDRFDGDRFDDDRFDGDPVTDPFGFPPVPPVVAAPRDVPDPVSAWAAWVPAAPDPRPRDDVPEPPPTGTGDDRQTRGDTGAARATTDAPRGPERPGSGPAGDADVPGRGPRPRTSGPDTAGPRGPSTPARDRAARIVPTPPGGQVATHPPPDTAAGTRPHPTGTDAATNTARGAHPTRPTDVAPAAVMHPPPDPVDIGAEPAGVPTAGASAGSSRPRTTSGTASGPHPAEPDPAEAAALAGAFAADYLSWDEDDPARRGQALADHLPGPVADRALLGWSGRGRQRAELVLPGAVRADGPGRLLVDVRVRVTPYRRVSRSDAAPEPEPGESLGSVAAAPPVTARGWRGLAARWVRLVVTVERDGDRLVVDAEEETVGEPATAGRPEPARNGPRPLTEDPTLDGDGGDDDAVVPVGGGR